MSHRFLSLQEAQDAAGVTLAPGQAVRWSGSWRPDDNALNCFRCRLPEEVREPGGRGGQAAAAAGGIALGDSTVVIGGALPSRRRRSLGERGPRSAAGRAARAAAVASSALDQALQGLARRLAAAAERLQQSVAWRRVGLAGWKPGYPAARRRLVEEEDEEPEVDKSSAAESNEVVPDELVDTGRGAAAAAAAAAGRAAPGSVVDRQRLFSVRACWLLSRCIVARRREGGLSHGAYHLAAWHPRECKIW